MQVHYLIAPALLGASECSFACGVWEDRVDCVAGTPSKNHCSDGFGFD
jgi:hypothetical protein